MVPAVRLSSAFPPLPLLPCFSLISSGKTSATTQLQVVLRYKHYRLARLAAHPAELTPGPEMASSVPTPFWTTRVVVQHRNHFLGTSGTTPIHCKPFSNDTHCRHPRRRSPSDPRVVGAGVEVGAGRLWVGENCNSRVS